MKISKVLSSSIACVFILTSSPFAYYANANEDTLINKSKEVEVYQPSGIKGSVNIPKADKSFDINEELATILSGTGEFSFSPTENEITRNFLRSEKSDDLFKVTQTNENELLIKITKHL